MSNKGSEIYPRHRLETLEPYYSRHVGAMTELPGRQEGLHSKSDIAEQLAWRDQAIANLRAALAEATKLRELCKCGHQMSEHIDGRCMWISSRYEPSGDVGCGCTEPAVQTREG